MCSKPVDSRPAAWWAWAAHGPLWSRLALLLAPMLLAVAAAGLWLTRQDALESAHAASDRSLLGALRAIDANLSSGSGGLAVELPYALFEFFELTASGRVYFRLATSDGLVELGSADLPLPATEPPPGEPRFYDAVYFGEPLRVAALRRPLQRTAPAAAGSGADDGVMLWLQVAEGTASREQFTKRLVGRLALRDLVLLLVLVAATGALLALALRPLARLADVLRARRADDMAPLRTDGLPADIRPLVEAVNQQQQRVQHLLQQQRTFLDDASHQLRTHLTTLQLQCDYLLRESGPPTPPPALQALATEIARARRSTQQLLALGRSDTAEIEPQPFATEDLLREVALTVLPLARARQMDLGIQPPPNAIQAHGDVTLLREALSNLASNAVAYCPPGSTITLSAAGDTLGWCLTVEDNGPGLRPEEAERLGQRYRRGTPSATAAHPGSGLGLAIARSVAERHGGTLRLESPAQGRGLRATLWWPQTP